MLTQRTSSSPLTWSLPIAALMVVSSLSGLIVPSVYAQETVNWMLQAQGQDVGNLIAAVVLLLSAQRYRAGSHRAGAVWLGTLLYVIYAFVVYAMAVHFSPLFLVYVAVLGLSAWAVIRHIDAFRATPPPVPTAPALRLAGWTLIATGILFGGLWLSELIPATASGQLPASLEEAGLWVNPIHVIDLSVVLPAFVITGLGALRLRADGLAWTAPWLTFSALMGTSIVAAMLLIAGHGFPGTLPPTVMVSVVVLVSLAALVRFLAGAPQPARVPAPLR
ncbi:hypothetical protein [Tessaracoccus lapidicaptus]|uniref:hypothetical protein n=1 Tax=Tessaracoccus lapidicaptus TaxID=1427523 RepID=UPI0033421677